MAKRKLKVGDKVRHSAKFMRSVGLVTHRNFKPWTITGFCGPDDVWAVLDAPNPTADEMYTAEEMKAEPCLRFLRVAYANLERAPGR